MVSKKTGKNHLSNDRGQCFVRLYTGIQRRLFGYVLSHIPNPSDAEDIVQETIVAMWSRFSEYEPGTNFAAWALCVARYQILTYRKKRTGKGRIFSEQAIEVIQNLAESTGDQEQERQKSLQFCLDKLGEKERKILYFRYEIGATLRTVSEQVNMNINTLYSVLNRIHILLLNCIRKDMRYKEYGP
jgi:RNA polymerase sigma-70 factor (ECF subfamily)